MFKVVISSKLESILRSRMVKCATDWRDQYVIHTTPGGKQTRVKIRSLPPEEQARYAPKKTTTGFELSPVQIQSEVKDFQTSANTAKTLTNKSTLTAAEQAQLKDANRKNRQAFERLYSNFLPMISKTMKTVIGERWHNTTTADREDIKQQAAQIFVKLLNIADANNPGLISYFKTSIENQLRGKVREIFRTPVSMDPKERQKLRAIQRYLHEYQQKYGEMPYDYDEMARDINRDKKNIEKQITTDATEIGALLQSGVVSLEERVDEGGSSRDIHEVLGPSKVRPGAGDTLLTPEEEQTEKEMKSVVLHSIESMGDATKEKVLKLKFGLMPQNELPEGYFEGEELNPRQISEIMGMPRSTVSREIDRAEARLRQNKDIQRLRQSSSIFRIIKSYNKHIKIAYVPDKIVKISKDSVLFDDKFLVKKFASQIVCNCGKDCLHRDAAKQYLN
jgi:RNA polymerase sigma factor (sigma-70 family)